MNKREPPAAAFLRRIVEASAARAQRIVSLRAAIAAGTYRVPAAKVAEAQIRSPEG